MDLQKIFVLIPALDEEATIAAVVTALRAQGLTNIWVIDNGSSDRTAQEAQEAGALVIHEPERGYGQACWRGIAQAPDSCEWILFCDGDGSDDISALEQFFAATTEADFILGNRRATEQGRRALTPVQNFGNGLATALIGLGWGYSYQDLGPLRLIRRQALEAIAMSDRSFGWTVEMQARAVELGLRIKEIPVAYRPRQGGRSKISGTLRGSWQAGSIILMTLGKLFTARLGRRPFTLWLSAFLLVLGTFLALPYGDFQQPGQVAPFWLGMGVMGLGYILSWSLAKISPLWFWAIALVTRGLMLAMEPGDDIWRYLWEGYLQNQGISPYQFAPDAAELLSYRTPWWELINNKDTAAIYPPLAQWGFRVLALLRPSVLIFKLAFVGADLAICGILSRFWGFSATLLYAWNPLVIYAFAGGGHYDSWFILPLVLAWWAWERGAWQKSAIWLGLSVAIKWVSLPLVVFFLGQLGKIQAIMAFLLSILPMVLTSLGFCFGQTCSLIPTGSVFVSFGRSAEFFPDLLGLVWPLSRQYNWIYVIPLALALLVIWRSQRTFVGFVQAYFAALLTLSPIVHAWYFTWLVPWSVKTRNLGIRWVSLSAFIYFILKERLSTGIYDWTLTPLERWGLWLPFFLGWLLSKPKKR